MNQLGGFNATLFDLEMNGMEEMWIYETQTFTTEPIGDTISIAKSLYTKWSLFQ